MNDTPDTTAETFAEAMARLGIENDESGGSTVVFLGPKGAAWARKIVESREPSADEPA